MESYIVLILHFYEIFTISFSLTFFEPDTLVCESGDKVHWMSDTCCLINMPCLPSPEFITMTYIFALPLFPFLEYGSLECKQLYILLLWCAQKLRGTARGPGQYQKFPFSIMDFLFILHYGKSIGKSCNMQWWMAKPQTTRGAVRLKCRLENIAVGGSKA